MGLLDTLKQMFRTTPERPPPPPGPERAGKTIEDQGERRGLEDTEGYEPRPDESEPGR